MLAPRWRNGPCLSPRLSLVVCCFISGRVCRGEMYRFEKKKKKKRDNNASVEKNFHLQIKFQVSNSSFELFFLPRAISSQGLHRSCANTISARSAHFATFSTSGSFP